MDKRTLYGLTTVGGQMRRQSHSDLVRLLGNDHPQYLEENTEIYNEYATGLYDSFFCRERDSGYAIPILSIASQDPSEIIFNIQRVAVGLVDIISKSNNGVKWTKLTVIGTQVTINNENQAIILATNTLYKDDSDINHTDPMLLDMNSAMNKSYDRIKNIGVDVIGMVDEDTTTIDYTSNNILVDNDTIKVSLENIDEAIGTRLYDNEEVITDGEIITTSLNSIGNFIHQEWYVEKGAYDAFQDFTKSGSDITYTITQDENCTTPAIVLGTDVLNDVDYLQITNSDGGLIYKEGSILPTASNVVKVSSYTPATSEITLNFAPKVDFRLNFKALYNRKSIPDGKIINSGTYFNVTSSDSTNEAREIEYDNSTSLLTATDVNSAIDELASEKQDNLTFGISDTNSIIIDSVDVVSGEYAKFTTAGLESKTFIEVKTDLSLENVDNTADLDKPISNAERIILDGLDANGVVEGITLSVNSDPTKFDISSGSYHIVLDGDALYTGDIAVTLTYLATHNATYIALSDTGTIIQQTAPYTPTQRRLYILIGTIIHSNRMTINAINNQPDVAVSGLAQLNDFMDGIDQFNKEGNKFSANGANLFINKSSGFLYKKGINFENDTNNPHLKNMITLEAPSNIRYRLSDSTETGDLQAVSKFYESSTGVLTAIPNNKFSVQRITLFSSNLVRIQYGQSIYGSIPLAQQGILTDPYVVEQNIAENGLLRGYLIISGGATDLTNVNDALFIEADKFGAFPSGATGGGTTSLQQAYNNSVTPEISTNATLGALSVKRGSTSDTDNVLEVLNGSDSIVWSVDGLGNVSSNANTITKEHTGFSIPEGVIVTYDVGTRTVTLGGVVDAYYQGKKVQSLISGWVSAPHDTTTVGWFLYYDGTDFIWSQVPWTFDLLMIAYIYYGANNKFAIKETHGLMQWQSHQESHEVTGTYRKSGGDLSNYILDSAISTDRRPYISACVVKDEDLITTNVSHTSQLYTKMYLTSTGVDNFIVETSDIVPLSGNQPYYNQFTGGLWQQTLLPNNSYMAVWLVAVPATSDVNSQKYRYFWIQGQHQGTLPTIQALQVSDLNLGTSDNIFTEFVVITKVILRYVSSNWRLVEVLNLTGSKVLQSSNPAGVYLSTVSTSSGISGDGTALTPITSDLITGINGGQTIIGSKLTTENLNIRANGVDLTTGQVNILSDKEATSVSVAATTIAGGLGVSKSVRATNAYLVTPTNTEGSVVTINGNQTLTNKILTDLLVSANGSLDVVSAGTFDIGASVGANNITLGGATSSVVIAGNLLVSSETTTLDIETKIIDSFLYLSYNSAIYDYEISNGSNRRVGRVKILSDGVLSYNSDNSEVELGDTSPVTFGATYVTGTINITATSTTSGWLVKFKKQYM